MSDQSNIIPPFKPEDYPDKVCCGWLEHLVAAGFKFPFSIKTAITARDENSVDSQDKWSVEFYKQDARSLGVNQRQHITIFFLYCPFCGKKIG
jgi:hypothetical protein